MSKSFYSHQEFSKLSVVSSAKPVSTLLTSATLGSNSNSHFFIGATTGRTFTLPAAASAAGQSYEFTVTATAASHLIQAPSASIIGSLAADVTATAGNIQSSGAAKTSLQTTAGSAVGDFFRLTSNGTNWFVRGQTAAFNGAKFNA